MFTATIAASHIDNIHMASGTMNGMQEIDLKLSVRSIFVLKHRKVSIADVCPAVSTSGNISTRLM